MIRQNNAISKIRIAKKVKMPLGFPKPLTCEEDFVLELKDRPVEFLTPLSGFYKLPEVDLEKDLKKMTSENFLDSRIIVGPIETFVKKANEKKNESVKELLRRNKSLMIFTKNTVQSMKLGEETRNVGKLNVEKAPSYENEQRKIETLHQKKQEYWKKVNRNLQKKVTIPLKKKFKKTMSLWEDLI